MHNTYIIGDVHGCYDELMDLLAHVGFNPQYDRLIFVGDLINRGPKSLAVLRFVHTLGEAAQLVLGNHDISLLAYACGAYHGRGCCFDEVLLSSEGYAWVHWLRRQPLLIEDARHRLVVVHAAIPPEWSLTKAIKQARKAERRLAGGNYGKYLKHAYQKKPVAASEKMHKYDKFSYCINGLTRLRYCQVDGQHDFVDKSPPGRQKPGLLPWFILRQRLYPDDNKLIVFGHWAALGFYRSQRVVCLDSGCAWGGALTALRVNASGMTRISVPAHKETG